MHNVRKRLKARQTSTLAVWPSPYTCALQRIPTMPLAQHQRRCLSRQLTDPWVWKQVTTKLSRTISRSFEAANGKLFETIYSQQTTTTWKDSIPPNQERTAYILVLAPRANFRTFLSRRQVSVVQLDFSFISKCGRKIYISMHLTHRKSWVETYKNSYCFPG